MFFSYSSFGSRLREQRKAMHYSQKRLAKETSISVKKLSQYERDLDIIPIMFLKKIENIGLDIYYIVTSCHYPFTMRGEYLQLYLAYKNADKNLQKAVLGVLEGNFQENKKSKK